MLSGYALHINATNDVLCIHRTSSMYSIYPFVTDSWLVNLLIKGSAVKK